MGVNGCSLFTTLVTLFFFSFPGGGGRSWGRAPRSIDARKTTSNESKSSRPPTPMGTQVPSTDPHTIATHESNLVVPRPCRLTELVRASRLDAAGSDAPTVVDHEGTRPFERLDEHILYKRRHRPLVCRRWRGSRVG